MIDCCVAHLVRHQNGIEVFRRYIASYRQHPAGVDHAHIMIFKGFSGAAALAPYEAELAGLDYQTCFVDDTGLDIGSYLKVPAAHRYPYYCFTNSYSRILAPGWLAKLHGAIAGAGKVGLVGASASFGSIASYSQLQAKDPSAYDGYILDDPFAPTPAKPPSTPEELFWHALRALRQRGGAVKRWATGALRSMLEGQPRGEKDSILDHFAPFPAPHVRSNSFVVRADVLTRLPPLEIRDKSDAFQFESGRTSLTNAVFAAGLDALVVGRDGRAYAKDEWPRSNTFWQGDQSNLLVADNQTDNYSDGTDRLRRFYSLFAWREWAQPKLSASAAQ